MISGPTHVNELGGREPSASTLADARASNWILDIVVVVQLDKKRKNRSSELLDTLVHSTSNVLRWAASSSCPVAQVGKTVHKLVVPLATGWCLSSDPVTRSPLSQIQIILEIRNSTMNQECLCQVTDGRQSDASA